MTRVPVTKHGTKKAIDQPSDELTAGEADELTGNPSERPLPFETAEEAVGNWNLI